MEPKGLLLCSQEHTAPILSHINQVHVPLTHAPIILFLEDLRGLFPPRFHTKTLYAYLLSPFVLHTPPI
jgi:hypothetical protein